MEEPMFGGFWLVVIVLGVLGAVLYARTNGQGLSGFSIRPRALDVLEERYAKGEIGRDEYLQKKADILGQGPV
jgi:putative membrane protein